MEPVGKFLHTQVTEVGGVARSAPRKSDSRRSAKHYGAKSLGIEMAFTKEPDK
jgi:hypothetical protein